MAKKVLCRRNLALEHRNTVARDCVLYGHFGARDVAPENRREVC